MFEIVDNYSQNAIIKVIGVGGAGGNAVDTMLRDTIHGADFIVANTDAQALRDIDGATTVQIGSEITNGLGAGADPEKGRQAALESKEQLQKTIEGADMLFIAAGMGGGTGTGAAPIIAQIARDLGILTVAVVTKPFEWEGKERMEHAEVGIVNLEEWVDSLIVIPNTKLMEVFGENGSIYSQFDNADGVITGAVKGIAEIITIRGFMNVDFADVKTVMSGKGKAMMGSAKAEGENRAEDAINAALSCPLLDSFNLQGATGVLVNITSGDDLTPKELNLIGRKIKDIADEEATIITGCIKEEDNLGELRVTIIATGFDEGTNINTVNSSLGSADNTNIDAQTPINSVEQAVVKPNITQMSFNTQSSLLNTEKSVNSDEDDEDENIDIPAFLRQQAD
ncbi:MAG: cell division protein FtsZ [Gammaproteobacteria bacterium]|nr:cell division protein FtsZ [Gammaproteobacteria bacterium]|tara:strand:+ start:436 stop:1623 length:1188 start_codon:yes stop_codon:yes gene_type:complete